MSAGSARDRHASGRRQNEEAEPFLVQQIPGSPVMRGRRQNSEDERFQVQQIPGSPVTRGRRQNSEDERFQVQQIPGSPVTRGRRQNSEDERFQVQQIPGSPVLRGRRRNSEEERFQAPEISRGRGRSSEEERFLVEDIEGSPVARGRVPRVIPASDTSVTTSPRFASSSTNRSGFSSTSDTVDGSLRMPATAPTAPTAPLSGYAASPTYSRPPDNDDAPPSYESSIPPTQIGWASEVISTVPFPVPYATGPTDGGSSSACPYPPADAYPPIGLSPLAKSYQSLDTSKSRSPMRSTSPSLSPSPDRCRPAYTHQHIRVARTPPPRPRYRVDNDSDRSVIKPQNDFSYKYGAIVLAIAFVAFLMILSLTVKLLIRNSFRQ